MRRCRCSAGSRKPAIVLLNQLGPPRPAAEERADVSRWATHLAAYPWVRDTIAFDAFARCWVLEHRLLEAIGAALPAERQAGFARLADAWRTRNRVTFEQSMRVLAQQLATTATDAVTVPTAGLRDAARSWLGGLLRPGERTDAAADAAMGELARRLDVEVRRATDQLIELHGLSGRAAAEILQRMGAEFAVDKAADPGKASVIGAALSGALGGLAADLAAGGLTFGAGALLGGVLGAAGARGLASAYNLARGSDATSVRWSPEFMTGRVSGAVLRYLAVAHFGRGRGDFVAGEYPPHWGPLVEQAVARHRAALGHAWSEALNGRTAPPRSNRGSARFARGDRRGSAGSAVSGQRSEVTVRRLLDEPQHDGSDQNERGNFHDVILLRAQKMRLQDHPAACLLRRSKSLTRVGFPRPTAAAAASSAIAPVIRTCPY